MATPMSALQRRQVSRKFMAMRQSGEISMEDLLQRMYHIRRNPEWENPKLAEADLHDKANTFGLLSRAFATEGRSALLDRRTNKSTDVLTTLAGSGAPLIRTDLDTMITNLWVDEFPGWNDFPKIESNGVAHNFIVSPDYDGADVLFANELDPSPKGQGVYAVMNAPIALALTERGSSLKELYAVRQSGMSYNGGQDAIDLELERGTVAMAHAFQTCVYQGTTVSGHTGTDEYGTYYSNGGVATGFQGLRGTLSGLAAFNSYYPTGAASAQDQGADTIVQSINRICRRIMNYGRRPTAIHMSANAAEQLAREGANIVRVDQRDSAGLTLGVSIDAILTVAGRLPIVVVPGDSIGHYTAGSNSVYNGSAVEDIYVLTAKTNEIAFLGSPEMTTIEIPLGVDGTLGQRYLMFGMFGLVQRAPLHNGKLRIPYVA